VAHSDHALQENLALFIAQFPLSQQEAVLDHLGDYEKSRQGSPDRSALPQQIQQCWNRRKNAYLEKIFRNCTDVVVEKNGQGMYWVSRARYSPALQKILDNPDKAISESVAGGKLLKDGNAQTLVIKEIDNIQIVIKRYNSKNIFKRMARQLVSSRAENCWRYAHLMKLCGILTPQPIAAVVKKQGFCKGPSYYISEFVPKQNSHDFFKLQPPSTTILRTVSNVFTLLNRAGVVHGDCKPQNWLTDNEKIWLIDFDGTSEPHGGGDREKDRQRFLSGWKNSPDLYRVFAEALLSVEKISGEKSSD